jgi:peroxiredoxin
MALHVGQQAPEFTLPDTEKKPRSLGDFLGKKTILVFFPGAFTGVCTKEMCAFRDSLAAFNTMQAQVVGVSVDGPWVGKAFAQINQLGFPLLSDYRRTVSRQYGGIQQDFSGLKDYEASKRAVFVLDSGGIVRYAWVSENPGVEPNYEEIRSALSAL